MTNDYTPDTQEVRELYWAVSGLPRRDPKAWEEFDRWLRKVKADAYDEGFEQGHYVNDSEDRNCGCRENPYRD